MSKFVRGVAEFLEKGHLLTYVVEHTGLVALPVSLSYWISALVFIPAVTFVLRHGEWACLRLSEAFAWINKIIASGWSAFCDGLIQGIQWMKN